jgi:hypothetical protein
MEEFLQANAIGRFRLMPSPVEAGFDPPQYGQHMSRGRGYAKHMPRALSEATIKFTSGHQSLIGAYAQHQLSTKKPIDDSIDAQNRADEITN